LGVKRLNANMDMAIARHTYGISESHNHQKNTPGDKKGADRNAWGRGNVARIS